MKNTRLIRSFFFAALLIALLFAPALAQSAIEDVQTQTIEEETRHSQINEVSDASQRVSDTRGGVLYQRVIAELVKTFYIA